MASNTTPASNRQRSTKAKTTKEKQMQAPAVTNPEVLDEQAATSASAQAVCVVEARHAARELSVHDYVIVRNGFNGKLVYKSKRTGETYVWDGFGAEQEMELQELKNAKNSSKDFFVNNWFMFDDPEVVRYLGVELHYHGALSIVEIDELFSKTPAEIRKAVARMSSGQRDTLVQRARHMVRNDEVDSIKVIQALENALGVKLLDR